jgi:hypothetical protein
MGKSAGSKESLSQPNGTIKNPDHVQEQASASQSSSLFFWLLRSHSRCKNQRQSAHGVVGRLYLKAALEDAPGFFPPRLTGWRALKHWLRVSPYRLRHSLRGAFVLPSIHKVEKVLRELWKRGLLVRAGWVYTDNEFYKLKN